MVGIIFDTSTKKGVVLPGLILTTYGYLGVIVGKLMLLLFRISDFSVSH